MDTAVAWYNCYTDITKSLSVSYVPSLAAGCSFQGRRLRPIEAVCASIARGS